MEFVSIKNYSNIYKLASFDCGVLLLNNYLKLYAKQNDSRNIGKTFVLVDDNNLVGFITLSSAQIEFSNMSEEYKKKNPRYPVPAIRIARLAIDIKYQHQGNGKRLMAFALKRVLEISALVAVKVILVNPKQESINYYLQFGFQKLYDESESLFLTVDNLAKAVS